MRETEALVEQAKRCREIEEGVYKRFCELANGAPEELWQWFAVHAALRLLNGVETSVRTQFFGKHMT